MHLSELGHPEASVPYGALGSAGRSLMAKSCFGSAGPLRLMPVGQDPTIPRRPQRVRHVRMAGEPSGQLFRWLRRLLGDSYDRATIHPTNVVKCSFLRPPSDLDLSALDALRAYARNCRHLLAQEVARCAPSLVPTIGESSHLIFLGALDSPALVGDALQPALTGQLLAVSTEEPCCVTRRASTSRDSAKRGPTALWFPS